MVQQAIREDVLRHHKTLLVWATKVDKHKAESELATAEDDAKKAIKNAKLN